MDRTPPGGDVAPTRPDAWTTRLVQDSCRALVGRQVPLADRFAGHLAGLGVPLAAAQAADLVDVIVLGMAAGDDPAVLERQWQELGARPTFAAHGGDGFARLGQALVRALRDTVRDEWSSTLSSVWAAFHLWMAGQLALGAARAAAAEPRAAAAYGDRARTDWTYEDLLSTRYRTAPAPPSGQPPAGTPGDGVTPRSGTA